MKISHKKRKISGFDIGITIITLLLISIVLYPLIFIMSSSVSDPTMVATGKVFLLPKGFTLAGYKRVFQDSNIMTGYANSLFYAVVGTCINLIVTVPAGYVLTKAEVPGPVTGSQYPDAEHFGVIAYYSPLFTDGQKWTSLTSVQPYFENREFAQEGDTFSGSPKCYWPHQGS